MYEGSGADTVFCVTGGVLWDVWLHLVVPDYLERVVYRVTVEG